MIQTIKRPKTSFDDMPLESRKEFAQLLLPHAKYLINQVRSINPNTEIPTKVLCEAIEILLNQGYFIVTMKEINKRLNSHLVSFCVYTPQGYKTMSEQIVYLGGDKCPGQ